MIRSALERNFEKIDVLLVAVATAAVFTWSRGFGGESKMLSILAGNRVPIYQSLGAFFAALFSFVIAAIAIVLAFAQSPRLNILRRSRQWVVLWRVFTLASRAFAAAGVWSVCALIFDRESSPSPGLIYVSVSVFFFGLLKLYRVIWAFENLIKILIRPDREIQPTTEDVFYSEATKG